MSDSLQDRYRHWRRALGPDSPASVAIAYARSERRYRDILAGLDWDFGQADYNSFARADFPHESGYIFRVLIGDDDMPTDWGDCEPTDEEREAASSYYVAIQVLGADEEELFHDGIGGVDVIDLPGYLQRSWEDAAAYALDEYLLPEAEHFAANESRERAEWAARDTITV